MVYVRCMHTCTATTYTTLHICSAVCAEAELNSIRNVIVVYAMSLPRCFCKAHSQRAYTADASFVTGLFHAAMRALCLRSITSSSIQTPPASHTAAAAAAAATTSCCAAMHVAT
jgi:hypothetical protein